MNYLSQWKFEECCKSIDYREIIPALKVLVFPNILPQGLLGILIDKQILQVEL